MNHITSSILRCLGLLMTCSVSFSAWSAESFCKQQPYLIDIPDTSKQFNISCAYHKPYASIGLLHTPKRTCNATLIDDNIVITDNSCVPSSNFKSSTMTQETYDWLKNSRFISGYWKKSSSSRLKARYYSRISDFWVGKRYAIVQTIGSIGEKFQASHAKLEPPSWHDEIHHIGSIVGVIQYAYLSNKTMQRKPYQLKGLPDEFGNGAVKIHDMTFLRPNPQRLPSIKLGAPIFSFAQANHQKIHRPFTMGGMVESTTKAIIFTPKRIETIEKVKAWLNSRSKPWLKDDFRLAK